MDVFEAAGYRFGRRLDVYRAQAGRVTSRQARRARRKLYRDSRYAELPGSEFVAAEAVEAGSDVMLRGTVIGQTTSRVFVQWRPGFPPEPCHRYGRSAPRYLTAADLAAEVSR